MCGNFGLLFLKKNQACDRKAEPVVYEDNPSALRTAGGKVYIQPPEDASTEVSDPLNSPMDILEAQASNTEIRGGQAGGYSTLEYTHSRNLLIDPLHPFQSLSRHGVDSQHSSHNSSTNVGIKPNLSTFDAEYLSIPHNTRIRAVARKRYPLAADLTKVLKSARNGKALNLNKTLTVIAHTRFATSSENLVPELHPHEWSPFKDEMVWTFNVIHGRFERCVTNMGVHITHNGDFDAFETYLQVMVNEEVAHWLSRLLYTYNPAKSDSCKIAGIMELFRVQGRWAAAARLAWVRTILTSSTDVCNGQLLTENAPRSFPPPAFWVQWSLFLEQHWVQHINNIVTPVTAPAQHLMAGRRFYYRINEAGVVQLKTALCKSIYDGNNRKVLGAERWSPSRIESFMHHAIRGFLKMDLYNAVTEFMSRAEGSFGLQVHCTLEPGVVIVASKGQPMSISYHPNTPLVLFASEGEALAVPVFQSGKSMPERMDLDGRGEIMRIGEPRPLLEGNYRDDHERAEEQQEAIKQKSWDEVVSFSSNERTVAARIAPSSSAGIAAVGMVTSQQASPKNPNLTGTGNGNGATASTHILNTQQCLLLPCGVEIRSYLLLSQAELSTRRLRDRSVVVHPPKVAYDPYADLVASDLNAVPSVLNAIDKAWTNRRSSQRIAGQALAECLVDNMKNRLKSNRDSIDLLVGGIEASLWVAEQFAADLRRVFPHLNVTTISTNKLLGYGDDDSSKVFFPTFEDHLERRITEDTCVLLVSQSGQTFSSLHATRKLALIVPEKVWILTGCVQSKMENVLEECYRLHGLAYDSGDRIIDNLSGHRPAEPTSVAIAATWHTLTRFLLHLVFTTRTLMPAGRIVHSWVYHKNATTIQTFFRLHSTKMRRLKRLATRSCEIEDMSSHSVQCSNHSNSGYGGGGGAGSQHGGRATVAGLAAGAGLRLSIPVDVAPSSRSRRGSNATHTPGASAGGLTPHSMPMVSPRASQDTGPTAATNMANVSLGHYDKPEVLMRLTDGCIQDLNTLFATNLIPNLCAIVGRDINGAALEEVHAVSSSHGVTSATSSSENGRDNQVHDRLVAQGQAWAEHIAESWKVLVIAGAYIVISVTFGIPLFGVLGDCIVRALKAVGVVDAGAEGLGVSLRHPYLFFAQPVPWIIASLAVQLLDAVFYIYLGKHLTRVMRILQGRAYGARLGKRTIVIVDHATVHQLVENFVSKLFSQSYSIVGVDVHGASGLDHFVHRFTHRVVRGVLLAVGRPDGRMCSLAKSEASILLAVKQAAFIRNPAYIGPSSGPEIVTIGHNPFQPNLGQASHVVLNSVTSSGVVEQQERMERATAVRRASNLRRASTFIEGVARTASGALTNNNNNNNQQQQPGMLSRQNSFTGVNSSVRKIDAAVLKTTYTDWKRHRFLDMYLYNRLYLSEKPFSVAILRSLRYSLEFEFETSRCAEHQMLKRYNNSTGNSGVRVQRLHSRTTSSSAPPPTGGTTGTGFGQAKMLPLPGGVNVDARPLLSNTTQKPSFAHDAAAVGAGRNALRASGLEQRRSNLVDMHFQQKSTSDLSSSTDPSGWTTGEEDINNKGKNFLPYGVHHINPAMLKNAPHIKDSTFANFVRNNFEILRKMRQQEVALAASQADGSSSKSAGAVAAATSRSSDPAMILAFTEKLDDQTKTIIDRQVVVQQLYECRIASLERYIAFCVMFHAMADAASKPWLCDQWNVARSQSNLRVATTASPISATSSAPVASNGKKEEEVVEVSRAVLYEARRKLAAFSRNVHTNF